MGRLGGRMEVTWIELLRGEANRKGTKTCEEVPKIRI